MVGDCINMAVRNMIRHGLRTILTMIGIIVGTCSVIAVYSVGNGGRTQILDAFQSFGFSGVIVSAPASDPFVLSDVEYIQTQIDEISSVMPLIYKSIRIGIQTPTISTSALGVGNNAIALSIAGAKHGRGFSQAEIEGAARVCMIDSELAQKTYGRENIVGKNICISINNQNEIFEIIGIISKTDTAIGSMLGDSAIFTYIPYTTYFEISQTSNFEAFIMSVHEDVYIDTVSNRTMNLLSAYTHKGGYYYENLSSHQNTINSVMHTVTIIISAIAAVSLIVGGLGVMTIMLVAVNERKLEIGMKKAIGATNSNIMAEFVSEAVAISLLGGVIGIVLGYLLSLAAGPILGINSNFDINIAICALLFCAGIGIIFSVYPAKKAAALDPINCLRMD